MTIKTIERRLFQCFAELLEYPQPGLVEATRECEALVSLEPSFPVSGKGHNEKAVVLLHEFRTFVEATPLGRLEEIFSSTFDLDAAYHPYVGYHLFGESYKRSVFLLELKERYRAERLDVPENELPDHFSVLLRFLAITDDAKQAGEIINEAMLPALERMMGKTKSAGYEEEKPSGLSDNRRLYNPYQGVLKALESVLQGFPTNDEGQSLSL
jgi:nitrate reductase molybdenum cofactor assembly chaperone